MLKLLSVLAIIIATIPFPVTAASETATITLTGTVTPNTCTLSTKTVTSTLPDVTIGAFGGSSGTLVSSVPVTVSFTGCGAGTPKFDVKVTGTQDTDISDGITFKNALTGTAAASGVGIRFYDADGSIFRPDGTRLASITPPAGGGSVNMVYTAKYVSTKPTVQAGNIKTVITILFTYS